jgi:DtxR family Mn-dependent transcriptional regulator
MYQGVGHHCTMVAVKDNSASFLQYVNKIGLNINNKIKVIARNEFDDLMEIEVNGKKSSVSPRFAKKIIIVCKDCTKIKFNSEGETIKKPNSDSLASFSDF